MSSQKKSMLGLIFAVSAIPAVAADIEPDKTDYTLFDPTPDAELRSFNTDRPPKANSPYTVDAGHFQYETDIAVYGFGNVDGITTHQWTLVDPTLKYGLSDSIDAELQVTPYEALTTRSVTSDGTASGAGDTIARLKVNLVGNDAGAVSVGLLPYIKIPTAPRNLGNRAVEGGLIVPVALIAPSGFTIIVMPEGDYLKNAGQAGYHAAFDFLVNVSHALDKRWTFFSEVFTSQPLKASYSATYTLDEALTCLLTPNLQLDFGGNFGLTSVTPRLQFYAGLSQRF